MNTIFNNIKVRLIIRNIQFTCTLFVGIAMLACNSLSAQDTKTKKFYWPFSNFAKKSNRMILKNDLLNERFADLSYEIQGCRTDEDFIRYQNNYGIYLLAKGSYKNSIGILTRAMNRVEDKGLEFDSEILIFNRGIAHIGSENLDSALLDFSDLDPTKFETNGLNYYFGYVYLKKGQVEEALNYFNKDMEVNNTFRSKMAIIGCLYELGRYEEARSVADKLGLVDEHICYSGLLGNLYSVCGDHKRALRFYKNMENDHGEDSRIRDPKITLNAYMNEVPALIPRQVVSDIACINELIMLNKMSLAEGIAERYKMKKKSKKHSGFAYNYTLSKLHYYNYSYKGAKRYFQRTLETNSNYCLPYLGLGACIAHEGNFRTAIDSYYVKAIDIDPNCLEAFEAKAICHFNLFESEQGRADIDYVLAINPKYQLSYDALSGYAFSLLTIDSVQLANRLFTECILKFPNLPAGYSGRGLYEEYITGDLDKAVHYFSRALRLDPSQSCNFANRANCVLKIITDSEVALKKKWNSKILLDNCEDDFKRAFELDEMNAYAMNGLSMVEAVRHNYEEAEELIREAMRINESNDQLNKQTQHDTKFSLLINYAFLLGWHAKYLQEMNEPESIIEYKLSESWAVSRLAIEVEPSDSLIMYVNYGVVLKCMGKYDRAISYYNQVDDPRFIPVRDNNIAVCNFLSSIKSKNDMLDSKSDSLWFESKSLIDIALIESEEMIYLPSVQYNVKTINQKLLKRQLISIYYYKPVMDWRPTNNNFQINLPPFRFKFDLPLELADMAFDNQTSGLCCPIKFEKKERESKFSTSQDDEKIRPCSKKKSIMKYVFKRRKSMKC
jgi:tetratricopeptide (TPR) repeat protein